MGRAEVREVTGKSFRASQADVDLFCCTLNEMGSHRGVLKGSFWLLCREYTKVSGWAKTEAGSSTRRLLL